MFHISDCDEVAMNIIYCVNVSGLDEASQLLQGLQENLSLSPVALYFEGLLFRCKVHKAYMIIYI